MRYWRYVIVGTVVLLSFTAKAQTFSASSVSAPKDDLQISDSSLIFDNKPTQDESLVASKENDDKEPKSVQNIQDAFDSTKQNTNNNKAIDPFALMYRAQSGKTNEADEQKKPISSIEEDDDFFVPADKIQDRIYTPTADGSKRGGQAFVMVDNKGNMKKVTNIFMFYDNFKIHHSFADYTTCDVRFNIISNLDRKLSQLDVKLVWPEITTTLSFEDISPNTQTYYNYTLLGKGCYSMDKAPNIVVNRCRAKGMTSVECAGKIKWLSK